MKLVPETKLDKRNTAMPKKFEDNFMTATCDVIVFFLIYDQFAAIRKLDFGRMASKTYIFYNNNLSSYKT